MSSSSQPLLYPPPTRASHHRTHYLILSLVAILGSSYLLAANFLNPGTPEVVAHGSSGHVCSEAADPTSCLALVSEVVPGTFLETHPQSLLQVLVRKSVLRTEKAVAAARDTARKINDPREQAALGDCVELLEMSMDRMLEAIASLKKLSAESRADAHTWLSSSLTNYETCSDGLHGPSKVAMKPLLDYLISRAKASLAMFVATLPTDHSADTFIDHLANKMPSWITASDRRLLSASSLDVAVTANVVVAKDGSGDYQTVQEAVDSAPNKGTSRYVIYVKKGTYKENVQVAKTKTNVMLVGDGMDQTIITGSLNYVDGTTTFNSATLAANGDGFIAQDLQIQNTAGPEKHQAVALRVSADKSVINRCKLDAYQDTLYSHTLRQFYRDSYITGTVDFIFGNAGVVIQNSKLVARKPMSKQSNMVTAQGRTDPNQNTGTSIQNCQIIASADLEPVKSSFKSYLGRPWKEYSRTVVMQSSIGDHIDPAGWSIWSGDFALSTLYYGEYMNKGAGAGTSQRVTWPGYHVITSAADANKFTVAELIQGGQWLGSTGVAYTEGL
ncbi:hypothetical protein SAY86_003385 [Trapa natans]|uniref:Pectinesterase n=1 Tax=Trapa natans TaxID=22666 RepID=A0AAN7RP73_TRANT|nr:hypothetical protein SAY86_003385 [Trapa natans]